MAVSTVTKIVKIHQKCENCRQKEIGTFFMDNCVFFDMNHAFHNLPNVTY